MLYLSGPSLAPSRSCNLQTFKALFFPWGRLESPAFRPCGMSKSTWPFQPPGRTRHFLRQSAILHDHLGYTVPTLFFSKLQHLDVAFVAATRGTLSPSASDRKDWSLFLSHMPSLAIYLLPSLCLAPCHVDACRCAAASTDSGGSG